MKRAISIILIILCHTAMAQKHTPLPHGMRYGQRVSTTGMMPADKLEAFMAKKARISTTITGRVLRVTKPKGGWFDMDADNGRIIQVHFRDVGINLPADLKGRSVIIQGVAEKQFIADDKQHFAGNTQPGNKQHQPLSFEASGLMVL